LGKAYTYLRWRTTLVEPPMQEQQLADASGEDSAAEDAPGVTEEETVETGGEDAVVETVDVAVVVVVATGTRASGSPLPNSAAW